MGLELKAEEKSILALFTGDKNQYIIPPYQRPYSWNKEQCRELFKDLEKAFKDKKINSYFLGNIVLASSREDKNRLEVIDGQQRLTTLTLLLKALLFFDKNNKKLKNSIWEVDDRTDEPKEQRLETMVFQDKDAKFLKEALELDLDSDSCKKTKEDNQFKKNICYFYEELKELEEDILFKFTDFLLYDVSILTIQTQGDKKDIARENALKIFETINNRGISLSTADIFKARLFARALSVGQSDEFINSWNLLYNKCLDINYPIDDIFDIYKNLIEIEKNMRYRDIPLREFFDNHQETPFFNKSYNEVMDSLFYIIETIQWIRDVKTNPNKYGELTKWTQIISEFLQNKNEKFIILILAKLDINNSEKIILKYQEIVNIIILRSGGFALRQLLYQHIINNSHNNKLFKNNKNRLLRNKAIILLTFYLNPNQKAIYPYNFIELLPENRIVNDFYFQFSNNKDIIKHLEKSNIEDNKVFANELQTTDLDSLIESIDDIRYKRLENFIKDSSEN